MLSRYDRAALHFGLEGLEIRRMLAVTASISNGTLNVNGTSGANTITLNKISNGKVTVTGVATQFTPGGGAGQFTKIFVNAGNGNDKVQINNNVPYTAATISGSGGNDTLTGGVGADSIAGDNNNDTLSGGGGGADKLVGGAGFDTSNYSDRADNLTISLDGAANDGANGGAEGDNVQTEEVITGSGNDSITGSADDDFIGAGAGKDTVKGNGGNDVVTGSSGSDSLLGGEGDDFVQAKNNDADTLSGGENSDGSTDFDLASVDGIDVPAAGAAAKALKKHLALLAPLDLPGGPSDLDVAYGVGGKQKGPDVNLDELNAVAVDSLGRVIFVGSTFSGYGAGEDMVVLRYNADGTFDTNFAGEGTRIIDFGTGYGYGEGTADDYAYGVAIGDDDSIYVVGASYEQGDAARFALAKLDDEGDLDNSFGDNGKRTLGLNNPGDGFDAIARDVVIQDDGSVVLAGDRTRREQEVTYNPANEFSVETNPGGVWSYGYSPELLDPVTLYDTPVRVDDGRDFWKSSELQSASTLAPDVQYYDGNEGESAGPLSAGTLALEPGFYGEYSQVIFTAPTAGTYDIRGEFSATLNEDSPSTDVHVLINGFSQYDGDVPGDSLEGASFDLPGFFLNPGDTVAFVVGYGDDQTFDDDTTALFAEVTRTSAPDDQEFAVARFLSDGDTDTSFGFGRGWNSFDAGNDEFGTSVALQTLADDFGAQRILVGGSSDGNTTVARFFDDGELDINFGDSGGYTNSVFGFASVINDLVVDDDNNIYAAGNLLADFAGEEEFEPDDYSALLVKFVEGGQIDTSEEFAGEEGFTSYNGLALDDFGRLIAVGEDAEDYLVGRYTLDLNFDTSFAEAPIRTDFTTDDNLVALVDAALGARVMEDGTIVVGGLSAELITSRSFDGFTGTPSAARYLGDAPVEEPFDIEQFIEDGDLGNPPPGLQALLNQLSKSAQLYIKSQPDSNGNVEIKTENSGGDLITLTTVTAADGTVNVAVTVNGVTSYYDTATTNSISINTDGGADTIEADSSITTKLLVFAGEGDDKIKGGGGRNLLFGQGGNDSVDGGNAGDIVSGGAGKDKLKGNNGNDILLGGPNSDSLEGGSGEDILVSGLTAYDTDLTALNALLDEWTSGGSNATRVSNIKNGTGLNAPFYLKPTGSDKTASDDSAKDTLVGGSDRDWFFRKNSGSNKDVLNGSLGSEEFSNL